MAKLAEAYFHLKPFEIKEPNLERLGMRASELALAAAISIYPADTELIIRLSAGSLKGWTTIVMAGIFTTCTAIANYKDFKEGLSEIIADGRRFSGAFIESFASETVKSPRQVFRTERRTKTPGKLMRATKRLEWLEKNQKYLSKTDVKRERAAITEILREAMQDLNEKDRSLVQDILNPDQDDPQSIDMPRVAVRHEIFAQLPLLSLDISAPTYTPDFEARFRIGEFFGTPPKFPSQ
ncbi:hypothetical protein [Methylocystis rosea]|uniref:hypothetical protein n=1 Tax=Methylocystis rosea TaxID=173366 RepID=UPI00036F357E|nr:hypothetical protein [Methylocystis rosea]